MIPDSAEKAMVPRKTLIAIVPDIANGSVVMAPISFKIAVPTSKPGKNPMTPSTSASSGIGQRGVLQALPARKAQV